MKRRNALTLAISLATALLAVALLRGCIVSQLRVTSAHCSPTLECGDRILVSRTYYGLRLPGEAVWGYHRWGTRYPKKGEWMVFHDPSDRHETEGRRRMCLARCEALPGDTVWIDPVRRRVLPWRTTTDAQPLRVPTAGSRIRVTPVNARLLWNTMRIHEQCRVVLLNDTALRFDGQRLEYAFFSKPYYWTFSPDGYDSGQFGFVPHTALVGRALCTSYSIDTTQPFFRWLRGSRFFQPLE